MKLIMQNKIVHKIKTIVTFDVKSIVRVSSRHLRDGIIFRYKFPLGLEGMVCNIPYHRGRVVYILHRPKVEYFYTDPRPWCVYRNALPRVSVRINILTTYMVRFDILFTVSMEMLKNIGKSHRV